MPELYVSWSDYHRHIEELAVQIYQSGWDFNQIVCIAKGGLRVGDILCRLFDRPLAILSAASYRGQGYRVRGEIVFSEHLSMVEEPMTSPTRASACAKRRTGCAGAMAIASLTSAPLSSGTKPAL